MNIKQVGLMLRVSLEAENIISEWTGIS